jgi:CheY-like chemotaxis protein/anti-sigma regulatory factor (Ser/Thr protein kinase)
MREVLVNLVYNALNAMPEGGDLMLSTRPYSDTQVEICVADTGVGMTPEVAARIFDPFFTTRGVEGTGLGLSVSWRIIQRFGGKIELDTAPGKGTRFMLRFPTADSAQSKQPAARNGTAPERGDGKRALVVDDEPMVASVLTTILARNGYRVVSAHSAKAALDCLQDDDGDRFDVVLSDHGMPGMTGLELLAEVKRRRPELPVVLLTGWGESILQVQITDVQPDAVLGKPINQADLVDAMAQVLRSAGKAK